MRQTRRKRTLSNTVKEGSHESQKEAEFNGNFKNKILEMSPADVPEDIAQNVWESLKEEFHASIEQLPLSFHRIFSLINEQDKEAQAHHAELYPTIRSYIKLRQSLQNFTGNTSSANESESFDQRLARDDTSEPQSCDKAESTPTEQADRRSSIDATPYRQHHDDGPSISPRRISRIKDATVPKSVPFPPRPKPKSTKELLVRLSFLLSEISNAIEEKVGLANAAHDLAIRHMKVLDAAIAEHDGPKFAVDAEDGLSQKGPTNDYNGVQREESGGFDEQHRNESLKRSSEPLPGRPKRRTREQSGISASTPTGQPPHEASGEERYCYCKQISYGEMVACDNPACEHEWFHLGCVGLSTLPSRRVKWYCPDCQLITEQNKKRKGH